jgi:hypothetical protein
VLVLKRRFNAGFEAPIDSVLAESEEPLNTKQMIDTMAAKGLWSSPAGKTPHATLYSAILREIGTKGDASRFRKVERGLFEFNATATN